MNKNKPLIIALDMDGTLLNSKKRISKKTLFYLRKLTKQGHKIVLCSGRPSRALEKYYKQLRLTTPLVRYNGAYIYSPYDKNFKTIVYDYPADFLLKVNKKIHRNVLNVMCESNDEIWVDKEDMFLDRFFWYKGMKIHVGKLEETLNKNTMTYIVHTYEGYKNKGEIEKILKDYPDIGVNYWTGNPYFELCHKNVTKGSGLKIIADYLGIPSSNIIAFGDSTNDIEMFDFAGTAVLMKNGKAQIKNADMTTKQDNDHDGIYYTLKELLG